jgi:hypothetical protein
MQITTHNPAAPRTEHEFYILNKGYNAGKPLHHPCPNCFTCQASSLEEKELYYWLCFGLWQGRAFRPYLIGSVIPFIRLNDLLQVLNHSGIQAIAEPAAFKVLVDTLNLLESREKVMKNTLTLLGEAKRATVHHYLTRR